MGLRLKAMQINDEEYQFAVSYKATLDIKVGHDGRQDVAEVYHQKKLLHPHVYGFRKLSPRT